MGECKEAIGLCDKVQNLYWRIILRVPESCPKVALRCETKMLGMKWRVWEEKIFLLMRIKNHEKDALCRQIYEEGKAKGWPGLGKEVTDICKEINIPDVNNEALAKTIVKEAIFNHHYEAMKKEMDGMTKLEPIKNYDFRQAQEYFKNKSIENGRMAFCIHSQMLDDIPGNFKNKYRKIKKKSSQRRRRWGYYHQRHQSCPTQCVACIWHSRHDFSILVTSLSSHFFLLLSSFMS